MSKADLSLNLSLCVLSEWLQELIDWSLTSMNILLITVMTVEKVCCKALAYQVS